MNTQNETIVSPTAIMPGQLHFHSLLALLQHSPQREDAGNWTIAESVKQHELASHSVQDNDGRLMHIYVAEGLYSYELGHYTAAI